MRTAEFDRTFVLRQAMMTFMQFGYAKTSMQKLTEATGLHPGSIYCAFKNKKGLLLASIEQYQIDKREKMQLHFEQFTSIKEGLKAFLSTIVFDCTQEECTKVCLLTKTLSELDGQDDEVSSILSKNMHQFEESITALIEKAVELGELPETTNVTAKSRFLTMGIHGLRTYAYTNPNVECLSELADQLVGYVFQTPC
ncbi:TetR/AcrR family transcriptional regulator [Pseudoalteromonas xiamenensis]|uniref:TetR/AcrR family transcriptional regulator n=1 Tax=Pseudoalteromonas xiamenensis TaxID=882626 RepID=UPI0027E4D4A9|nr:TetR/AcrR family transcriptional regulator [Pseudoalteromonas xiamenensis]WMN59813.1 TetR/AcrR family transcriptional regulator [Pseudoalteromonas xiamenensis]